MIKSIFLLALLGAVATLAQLADEARPPSCGPNEHLEASSTTCQISCDNMHLEPVMGACASTNACFCNRGYVRNNEGICIKRENCSPKPTCPLNEHYENDSHRCTISCDILDLEPILGACDLHSGCFCDDGYVRNDKGICIKRENCPPRCPPFERYLYQTGQCQIRCKDMSIEPYMGPCWPTSGCFCLPGYVRNDLTGICIRRETCPKPPGACGINEVSTDCYNDCQTTCKNRIIGDGKSCTLACTRTGCVCKPDYYRHDNGTCVPVYECSPADCNKGEVYTTCGSACQETCDNRGDTCRVCTQQCVVGCVCAGTTIRGPDGTCVEPRNCPPRKCGKNEVFNKCPPTCPPTEDCSNIWSRINCSNPIDCCTPSCRCKSGFYRNAQNVCISTKQCMTNPSAKAQSDGAEASAEASA